MIRLADNEESIFFAWLAFAGIANYTLQWKVIADMGRYRHDGSGRTIAANGFK